MLDPKAHDWTLHPGEGVGPLLFGMSRHEAATVLGSPDETDVPFQEPDGRNDRKPLATLRRELAEFEKRCHERGDLVDTWWLKGGKNRLNLSFENDGLVEIHGGLPWRGLVCNGVNIGGANRWRSVLELMPYAETVVRDWKGGYAFIDLGLLIGAPDTPTEGNAFYARRPEGLEAMLREDVADGLWDSGGMAVVKGEFAVPSG